MNVPNMETIRKILDRVAYGTATADDAEKLREAIDALVNALSTVAAGQVLASWIAVKLLDDLGALNHVGGDGSWVEHRLIGTN